MSAGGHCPENTQHTVMRAISAVLLSGCVSFRAANIIYVTYLCHSYLLGPHNVKCLYAFETGIADTELSTYIALN